MHSFGSGGLCVFVMARAAIPAIITEIKIASVGESVTRPELVQNNRLALGTPRWACRGEDAGVPE